MMVLAKNLAAALFRKKGKINKQFQVGDRVKYFEPFGRHLSHGVIEKFYNKRSMVISIPSEGVGMTAKKENGRWFAFSLYDREYTLEVFPEDKIIPNFWVKNSLRRLEGKFSKKLKWPLQRLLKMKVR